MEIIEPTLLMLGGELAGTSLLLNMELPTTGSESPESGSILTLGAANSTAATEAITIGLDIFTPLSTGEEGDGETIVITGRRPPIPEVTDGDNGTAGGGGGAGDGGDGGSDSETDANDCRDRSALDIAKEVSNENDRDVNEHGSIIYRDANGQVQRSPLFQGDAGKIPLTQIFAWMAENGVSMSQVIGLVHNHPAWLYGKTLEAMNLNRYPSGGVVNGGDWNAAEYMVSHGAGGPNGSNFALYVIDTVGDIREFEYSDKEVYKNLDKEKREAGIALPDEMEDDGTSCG